MFCQYIKGPVFPVSFGSFVPSAALSWLFRPAESFSGTLGRKKDGARDDVIKTVIVIVFAMNFVLTF